MKTKFLKLLSISVFLFLSCSSEDSKTEENSTNNNTVVETWVKLTATTSSGQTRPNYIIAMFEVPVTSTSALPPIKKQVTTDTNGLANINLNDIATDTNKTYYFEAFVNENGNWVWKSITHPSFEIRKGTKITSSIIVN